MAMVGNDLGDAILAAVNAVPQPPVDRTAIYRAIGTAIVTYIQAHAQVVVTNVGGVTPGGGTSGPGTGTVA